MLAVAAEAAWANGASGTSWRPNGLKAFPHLKPRAMLEGRLPRRPLWEPEAAHAACFWRGSRVRPAKCRHWKRLCRSTRLKAAARGGCQARGARCPLTHWLGWAQIGSCASCFKTLYPDPWLYAAGHPRQHQDRPRHGNVPMAADDARASTAARRRAAQTRWRQDGRGGEY
jgi:hypothetical protein